MPVRVRVPALPGADRADEEEPRAAADRLREVRQGVSHAVGREAGGQGAAARRGGERAVRAGPQLLQQAVERLAVRADQPRRLHSRSRSTDAELPLEDRWLLSRLATVTGEVTDGARAIPLRRRGPHALRLRLERVLQLLRGDGEGAVADPASRAATQTMLAHALDTLLRLLHPMMPFVTEEIWSHLGAAAPVRGLESPHPAAAFLMLAPWPQVDARDTGDQSIEQQFAVFREVLGAIRRIRSSQNIPPRDSVPVAIRCDRQTETLLAPMRALLESLATAEVVTLGPDATAFATDAPLAIPQFDIEVHVDLEQFIDVEAELQRLERLLGQIVKQISGKQQKLQNDSFVSRAPEQVVVQERQSLEDLQRQHSSVTADIEKLKSRAAS